MKKKISIPATMKAAVIADQMLIMQDRPVPKPAKGEMLVKVYAAGINRPDLLQRKGLYPPPPGITDIPGLEIAGEVVALGKNAGGFKNGARICALVAGGGYAEYCVVPVQQCLPVPGKLNFVEAASLPETFFTVWRNLFGFGCLQKGETALIHGGSSGIGITAIQMAQALGAKVFATAGTDDKCKACTKLGAKLAINYRRFDFVTEINKATDNKGVDVVLDMVGGDYIARNLQILKTGGRHVSIAMQRGRKAEIDLSQVISKNLILTGSALRAQNPAVKGALAADLKKKIWPLLVKRKIKPVIDRTYRLDEAQAAHDYLEAGNHIGKIVLKMV